MGKSSSVRLEIYTVEADLEKSSSYFKNFLTEKDAKPIFSLFSAKVLSGNPKMDAVDHINFKFNLCTCENEMEDRNFQQVCQKSSQRRR